jgi:hypothetical protein
MKCRPLGLALMERYEVATAGGKGNTTVQLRSHPNTSLYY